MGKILVVAEKPSVAKDIAKVLGCTLKDNGYIIGEEYIVSWAIGHLVTLAEPEDYDPKYKKWNYQTLPILPKEMKLKAITNTRSQLKVLHKLMNQEETDSIICATDSGREGELIFRYIYDITKCKKMFSRLWISSMTDEAIKNGFANIKPSSAYDLLYQSAKCRSEADWLVGMNATRAYTVKYDALLSIGRVQTPTLALMVEKQKEINAFESKDYYEVYARYGSFVGLWILDQDNSSRITEQEKAEAIAKKVEGQDGVVSNIITEEKRQLHPMLYDLTLLQRECNQKLGYSAKKTLDIAQSLYEKRKMITYPRTDSNYLSDDMVDKVKNTLEKLSAVSPYDGYAKTILELEKLPISKRIMDNSKVTDHHAIIPTDGNISVDSLSPEEKNVYHLIALRFLAVFYPPYRYLVTKVYTNVLEEKFISKGTIVLELGWMAIYQDLEGEHKKEKGKESKKKKDEGEEQVLPPLKKGQEVHAESAEACKKKTTPPKAYTESSLLSAMEHAGRFVDDEALKEQLKDSGLGTPATRAAIIERLIAVGYITRKGKALLPTVKGMQLIEIVPTELKSPQTTGKWEKGLTSIAKGGMSQERFMDSINRYVSFLVGAAANINKEVVFEKEDRGRGKGSGKKLGDCPLCKDGSILENTKAYFCSNWRRGCKFSMWKDSVEKYGVNLTPANAKKLLTNKKIEGVKMTMPQTKEAGVGTLILSPDNTGRLEIMDFTRNTEEETK